MLIVKIRHFREADIIYEEGKDPVMRKIVAARLIACEMMQQLFGNLVSPSWWSYLWLNDGIAMLFGIEVLNEVFLYILPYFS